VLHFLLYTGAGSLVMVGVPAAVVAVAVWWTMRLAVSAVAFALWRLWRPLDHGRQRGHAAPTDVRR
jgi:hypothetical protein